MRNAISSAFRLVVVLGVMAPNASEAITLVFELATTVGAVPAPLQHVLAPGDPIRLGFEVHSGTEDALPENAEAALYPLGLQNIELIVGGFKNHGAWGNLFITRGGFALSPYASFSAMRDTHHFFYGPGVGEVTLSAFVVGFVQVPRSIDPNDVRGLLALA
ncbi:MAG: hypothetical protein GY930_06655 [bacterium]|nr:hypothetical protein [bacterium]